MEMRHMENQMADLRRAHNDTRRKTVRLQRNIMDTEDGSTVLMSITKQAYSAEIAHLENLAIEVANEHMAAVKTLKRRGIVLALRLHGAARR